MGVHVGFLFLEKKNCALNGGNTVENWARNDKFIQKS